MRALTKTVTVATGANQTRNIIMGAIYRRWTLCGRVIVIIAGPKRMQGKTHLSSISIYAGEILQSLDKARRAVESVTICIVSRLSAQRYRFKGSLSTLLRCGTACDDGRSSVVVCSD